MDTATAFCTPPSLSLFLYPSISPLSLSLSLSLSLHLLPSFLYLPSSCSDSPSHLIPHLLSPSLSLSLSLPLSLSLSLYSSHTLALWHQSVASPLHSAFISSAPRWPEPELCSAWQERPRRMGWQASEGADAITASTVAAAAA